MNRSILVFVAVAYALSIALSLVVGLTGGYQSPLIGLGIISMFLPAIAVLIIRSAMNEPPRIDWRRCPPGYIPVALLLMPVVMHVVMLPLAATLNGRLAWQEWLTPKADGLYYTPASRGWGTLTLAGLVARMAINAGTGLSVVSFLAFFEEVGWRGWLLPRLVDRMGIRRGLVLTSVIWAFWHTPYALSGIQHLDGVSITRTAMIMPIGIVGSGLVIGWLWIRTESIWIVSLAHGALNNWGQYAFKYMREAAGPHDDLVLAAGGVAVLAVGSLLVAFGLPSGAPPAASGGSSRSESPWRRDQEALHPPVTELDARRG
jgi:membrane protease YdiL (CAAX protease family)